MNYYNSETLLEQQQEIEKLKEQNAALAAQVEALKKPLQLRVDLMASGDEPGESSEWYKSAVLALETTPQQHLAEIKAQAVASAVNAHPEKVAYIQFEAQTRTKGFHCEIWLSSSDLIRYADSIRRGEVK